MWAVWFVSMDQRLYIAPLGLRSDDVVSASLFGGFCFLVKLERIKQRKRRMMSVMSSGGCAEVLSVKNVLMVRFNLRV